MLDYIIKKFRINSEYINDFKGINNYFDNNNINLEERIKILRAIYDYNNEVYSNFCSENLKIEKILLNRPKEKIEDKLPQVYKNVLEMRKTTKLDLDISFYLYYLKSCKTNEELEEILNMAKDSSENILFLINLNLLQSIVEYKKIMFEEKNNSSIEEIKFIADEISELQQKINYIKDFVNRKESDQIVHPLINELYFLKTNYGNVCALTDLKEIPAEFYTYFLDLLENMKKGIFKNPKVFTSNNALKGLSEVKENCARIVFDRIGNHKYVIIDMFIKKVDKSSDYHSDLKNRNDLYRRRYEQIKLKSSNDDEFIFDNKKVEDQIMKILRLGNKKG